MKQKVHNLQIEPDFKLIAISSHLSDYKLSWLLNEELKLRFGQADDLLVTDSKTKAISKFSVFIFEEENGSSYTLYSNRSENELLLKSLKHIDFLLKFHGSMPEADLNSLLIKVKSLQNILTAYFVDLQQIKQKELEYFL